MQGGVINDLVLLSTVGILPVLVHGGGPEINQWLKKVGIESKFDPETGLRVTDGVACLPHPPPFCALLGDASRPRLCANRDFSFC